MEPERRRHCFQPLRALHARSPRQACPRNISQEGYASLLNLRPLVPDPIDPLRLNLPIRWILPWLPCALTLTRVTT